ncbi:hypothetical protein [Knoellia aerolata]|uniref:Uncharacterized protein n=1 Tax=Knoellia aerolata DSM 18566 TaxID=1385519 RepID=A0A0A0JUE0_9MICO|nr:hypothetical protein [Knoellia aerolata]KGN40329.1 hypothetical protein N801_14935 [Knoellia aerolata DSM 18566]
MTTSHLTPRGDRTATSGTPGRDADRAYRRAWWSLALFPVSVVLAFLVGEGIFSLLSNGEGDPGVWTVLLAAVPALGVMVVPGALALQQGRKARRLGRRDGMVPAIVGAVVALGFVGLNAASYLIGLLVD